MRSSENRRRAVAAAACAALLLAACTSAPSAEPVRVQDTACPVAGPALGPHQVSLAQQLQHGALASPLFAAGIAPSGIAACRVEGAPGAVSVDYRATNGNELHVRRDDTIEYTEWEARFVAPPAQATPLLQQAERAAFGAGGCGIDWQHPETRSAGGGSEVRFRGDTCQCQAIVRRDAAGRVVALGLRSTC